MPKVMNGFRIYLAEKIRQYENVGGTYEDWFRKQANCSIEEFVRLAKTPEFGEAKTLVNDLGPGWGGEPPRLIFHLTEEMMHQI